MTILALPPAPPAPESAPTVACCGGAAATPSPAELAFAAALAVEVHDGAAPPLVPPVTEAVAQPAAEPEFAAPSPGAEAVVWRAVQVAWQPPAPASPGPAAREGEDGRAGPGAAAVPLAGADPVPAAAAGAAALVIALPCLPATLALPAPPSQAPTAGGAETVPAPAVRLTAPAPAVPARLPGPAAPSTDGGEAPVPAAPGPAPEPPPGAAGAAPPVAVLQPAASPQPQVVQARHPDSAPAEAAGAPPPLTGQLSGAIARLRAAPHGAHVLTVHVEPEHLGPVRVSAHISDDGVRIELLGATDASREALRHALTELRRDLAVTGLDADLRLASDPGESGRPAPQGGWRERGGDHHRGEPRPGPHGPAPPRPEPPPTARIAPAGSLDLLA